MKKLVSETILTRLSHDIVGNIGAVSNAVELLEEGDLDFIDDIKSILKTSSQTLANRMKFFRLAFGLDNPNLEDENIVKSIAQNYLLTLVLFGRIKKSVDYSHLKISSKSFFCKRRALYRRAF